MKRLENKIALITGGATGIGEAICKKFVKEGAKIMIAGTPQDPVREVCESINNNEGTAIYYEGDLSQAKDAIACIKQTTDEYGQLDILVNNAGVFPEVSELTEYEDELFDNMLKNNLRTAYMMSKHALPELHKTRGNIVSAGSEAGHVGIAKNTPYGGTKGFMHAFMKGLAVEQAAYGVRVNCVCPGAIDTAWTHKETSGMDDQMEQMLKSATPMGRRGTAEEIANVYAFVASDEASFVTGALYYVDGGITISKGPNGEQAHESMKKPPKGELNLEHIHEGATEAR
ncbi:SDR family NAD(P)-dependent oxidoreductase [Porifericola rhodea]|uniref:SDR family NAD(P)-dependent oxidoreductase n=1 Tax=Porifericola rhodea TaxID=930972 RepID=UPI0026665446|nr:SDR family oxidoreductase [Porifericola rhodea]WKN30691.1 SDR family NAD(P)-dependent oxidoreductase [Porifericola rhodea]